MSSTARSPSSAGSFATSRRGGLTNEEIRMIEALRAKDRPEPWQALSARFGRPVEDIKAVCSAPRPVVEIKPYLPEPALATPLPPVNTPAALLPGLWIAGLSVDQISNILGIDDRSVRRLREKLGLPPRYRGGDQ